jgi:prepilin-type processing-associated H-X9-DG protein
MYSRATMRTSHCKANLHQIGLAMQMYVDRQGPFGVFPDAAILPTLTPNRPTIAQVLGPFIEQSKPVFVCPSDTVYAMEQGLSYEYPASRLAGKRRPQLTANRSGEDVYSSSEVMLMYDFENFHGVWQEGSRLNPDDENTWLRGSRNFLYLDGHVDNF